MRDPDNFPDERISNSIPIVNNAATASNQNVHFDVGRKTTSVHVVEGVLDALFRGKSFELSISPFSNRFTIIK
jgi:hypothetical protein